MTPLNTMQNYPTRQFLTSTRSTRPLALEGPPLSRQKCCRVQFRTPKSRNITEKPLTPLFENPQLLATLRPMLDELTRFRREIHAHPCLSGQEQDTADRIVEWLHKNAAPSEVVTHLGGTGVAAFYDSGRAGPTVMLRAELDALPLEDQEDLEHHSRHPGIAHKCGHDGHAATLCAVAFLLNNHPLPVGRAVLHWQPAEETGEGARAVLADPNFEMLGIDWAFSWHNVPGYPLGEACYKAGPFAPASVGLELELHGRHSHAGEPHNGLNPALTVAQIVQTLTGLPAVLGGMYQHGLVTPNTIQMGHGDFGISPADATLGFTLRSATDEGLERLVKAARERVEHICKAWGGDLSFRSRDPFSATINWIEGVDVVREAVLECQTPHRSLENGFSWSEDFGEFIRRVPGANFAIGAGVDHPPLHSENYDFPDQLIKKAAPLFYSVAWHAVQHEPPAKPADGH
jgi:amidohydrolase